MAVLEGKVWRYGDNIDTDVIIPARYLNTFDPKELASHCMVDIDPTFAKEVKAGDIMVGGRNFGCGSSREHAPVAIKASGIPVIIAESFARIFYRNGINVGLPHGSDRFRNLPGRTADSGSQRSTGPHRGAEGGQVIWQS